MEESKTEICMLRRRIAELEEERQADKEKIKELESDNYECNNRISDYIETINKIREEFLKYDWKNSNNEQIYNQLKSLYNEIFENKAKESGEIDEC